MDIATKASRTRITLPALLVFSLFAACSAPVPATNPSKEPLGPPDRVDVVYFHEGEACHCMDVMGDRIYTTIFFNFQDEQASGKLTFQRLKIDDEANAATAEKYNATPFTLFINVVRGNTEHIIAVPEILSLKYDEEALAELVKSKIRQSLNGYIDEDLEQ